MQISRTTSANNENRQLQQATDTNAIKNKTDDYLFQENNKVILFKADISDPTTSNSAPAIIGAMLSTFADEVINFLGINDNSELEIPEEDKTNKITPTAETTNYIA